MSTRSTTAGLQAAPHTVGVEVRIFGGVIGGQGAAETMDLIVVTIPQKNIPNLPAGLFAAHGQFSELRGASVAFSRGSHDIVPAINAQRRAMDNAGSHS